VPHRSMDVVFRRIGFAIQKEYIYNDSLYKKTYAYDY
jgi:hypothetical protein